MLLLCFSLFAPPTVSAVCTITSTADCNLMYPPPPNATTCKDGSGKQTACCSNKTLGAWIPDNCPVNGVTPTPRPGCGNNNQVCCPGAVCRNATDTCFNIPDLGGYCMTQSQIDAWNKKIDQEKDQVNLWCGDPANPGIRTAIGCIPTSPKGLVSLIAGWTAGLGSGVALLFIFYAGFIMTTAGGDVKKVNSARTIITSAVIGLAIIVLAVIILNFIGLRLFGLNRFGFGV